MIAESLELENFRNYRSLKVKFDPGTNLFYGDNAQGKTNILESIYLCGTTKSHRGSRDRELIRFGEEESHIRMKVIRGGSPIRIDMHLRKQKTKGIAINGVPIRKASELFGIANFVFFSPEDLNIIKNGPGERRRFVDMELCQLNRLYLHQLANYHKVVAQRNHLLKEAGFRSDLLDTLDVWDMQMVQYGKQIIKARREFVKRLSPLVEEIHGKLSGEREKLEIRYEENCPAEELEDALRRSRERDLKFKMSMVGPHRDDIGFQIKGADIRKFGSQGQQRTAALALKLSEIELVKQELNDTPILLLDDVLSELDSKRQRYLLDNIHDIQAFITCTGLDDFVENRFKLNKVFHVVEGKVYE